MKSSFQNFRTTATVAIAIPFAVFLWLLTSNGISGSTLAMLGVLAVAGGAIALQTWRSSQATESVGQLLHQTNEAVAPSGRRAPTAPGEPVTGGR